MRPEDVGAETTLVLGKHSGRHAVKRRCEKLGFDLSRGELDVVYREVLRLANRRKPVNDTRIAAVIDRMRSAWGGPQDPPPPARDRYRGL